jgi:DNA polymerase-3 subunit delta'
MAMRCEKAYELIEGAHERDRLAHAFLISGPAGCGKQELASRVVDLLNPPADAGGTDLFGAPEALPPARDLDELEGEFVHLVRPRSKSRLISVAEMRELEGRLYLAAPNGVWKVGVIVDADRMNESAENAFLKTLEEPPGRCLLLLLSAYPEFLLPTIRSRCVNLALQGTQRPEILGSEEKAGFIALLARATGKASPQHALLLKAGFEALLADRKKAITDKNAAALKEEEKMYKNVTEGDWLEKRDEYYKALTSSEYLGVRAALVGWIIDWVGDALRQKIGAGGLSFPQQAKQTGKLADGKEVSDLVRRLEALEELGRLLETNTSETLALEVSFLRAFG